MIALAPSVVAVVVVAVVVIAAVAVYLGIFGQRLVLHCSCSSWMTSFVKAFAFAVFTALVARLAILSVYFTIYRIYEYLLCGMMLLFLLLVFSPTKHFC